MSQVPFSFSDSAVLARLSQDVSILTNDSLAGRKAGSYEEKKASGYIIRGFREAGLEPGATDTSFLQPFPVESFNIPRGLNTMSMDGWDKTLFVQYHFSPAAYSGDGHMEGNNYMLLDLSHFNWDRQAPSGELIVSLRQSIREAFQRGSAAVILYNDDFVEGPEADSLYDRLHVKAEKGIVIAVSHEVASYLLTHQGVKISISVKVERSSLLCNNVIGYLDHKAPSTIIIGAHYDHLGKNSNGRVFAGADDNASGTAIMMELARWIKQQGDKTNNYLFLAFSGEEEGLIGSGWYVLHPTIALDSVNFMVNLDMVGRLGCEGNLVTVFGTASSPMWHSLYKAVPHPAFRMSKVKGIHNFSDHLDFYRKKIPIISVTTGLHYEYHTTRDVAETLNYSGMADIVKYLEGILGYTASRNKAGYHKVSGWNNFGANLKIVINGINHLLSAGSEN